MNYAKIYSSQQVAPLYSADANMDLKASRVECVRIPRVDCGYMQSLLWLFMRDEVARRYKI